jgi:hypothetical protein
MEPKDDDALAEQEGAAGAKRPWAAPKVIVSEAVNRGAFAKSIPTVRNVEGHSPGTISTS